MTDVPPSRYYVAFTSAQAISAIGSWMQKTGMGWLMWDLTHSVAWVGALALCELVSALWVAPLAGAVTDRSNAYRLVAGTQVMLLVQAVALAGVTAAGQMTAWLLLAFALGESSLQGFNQPVRMTVIGSLAGSARMARAIAFSSMTFNLARSVGPALAGITMAGGSVALVFVLNASSFLAMLMAVFYVKRHIDRPPAGRHATLRGDISEGYSYILRTPRIATVMLLALSFSLLGRPFGELLPAFAGDVFGGGPQTLSLLMSAQGLGATAGALWMLRARSTEALLQLALTSAIVFSVAMVAFTAGSVLSYACVAMLIAGIGHVVCNIAMQSLVQLMAVPSFRGRSVALYSLIFRAGPALGAFVIGLAAPFVGLQLLVGLGAALFGASVMLGFMPVSRRLFGAQPAGV